MENCIRLTYKGRKYELTFTRESVSKMERAGFEFENVTKFPLTSIRSLFHGAFLANHRNLSANVIDDLFEHLPNKADVIAKLSELYHQPAAALFDVPDEASGEEMCEVEM